MAPSVHRFSVRGEASDGEFARGADRPWWIDLGESETTPSWVILGKEALVSRTSDGDLPPGVAFLRLAMVAPPRVSLLTVPRLMFPSAPTPESFPSIVAADKGTGLLLLHADQGRAKGDIVIDLPGRLEFVKPDFIPAYYVLNGSRARVLTLPNPEYIVHDAYMVAELQFKEEGRKGNMATLLCFSTVVGEWVEKEVPYPPL